MVVDLLHHPLRLMREALAPAQHRATWEGDPVLSETQRAHFGDEILAIQRILAGFSQVNSRTRRFPG